MKRSTIMAKACQKFSDGLASVLRASSSIRQSLEMWSETRVSDLSSKEVVGLLVKNKLNDHNPTYGRLALTLDGESICSGSEVDINDLGWNDLSYTTSGGLEWGWWYEEDRWVFYIKHPTGSFSDESSLLKQGLKAGFKLRLDPNPNAR